MHTAALCSSANAKIIQILEIANGTHSDRREKLFQIITISDVILYDQLSNVLSNVQEKRSLEWDICKKKKKMEDILIDTKMHFGTAQING